MAGISSRALNNAPVNRRGYNGNELQSKEFSDGSGLDFYDFNARTYDQQIGRFLHIDPLADQRVSLTPYNFVQNNPINRTDPTGALDDWYRNNNTGDYEWFNGSEEIAGYEHKGSSTTINSYTNYNGKKDILQTYSLNSNGSVTSNGETYGNGETVTTQGGTSIITGTGTSETSYFDIKNTQGTALISLGASANQVIGIGGVGGGLETDLIGIKDNEFRMFGMAKDKTNILRGYAHGDFIVGAGYEREEWRNNTGQLQSTTETSGSIGLGIFSLKMKSTTNNITKANTTTLGFSVGFDYGYILNFHGGLFVPFITEKNIPNK
jgi:RHS repeat-associated protein